MITTRASGPTDRLLIPLLVLLATVPGPGPARGSPPAGSGALVEVASSGRRWTGVAVGPGGRIFVNFPRWSDDVPISVAEIDAGGQPRAYPGAEINRFGENVDPSTHFVCVQSVVADSRGMLWILDPASLGATGVVTGGAKLVQVDPATDRVVRTYPLGFDVAPPASYLNDVRVDHAGSTAYISDSGLGAIVVLDLETGRARRCLEDHPATKSEETVLRIGGRDWLRAGGDRPRVHCDGIALAPDGRDLYFQALTARTLHRIDTASLRDVSLEPDALGRRVVRICDWGAMDGLICDSSGRVLGTSVETDSIVVLTIPPVSAASGTTIGIATLVHDARIRWPDSLAWGPRGDLYLTTSRINEGANPANPFKIYRIAAGFPGTN